MVGFGQRWRTVTSPSPVGGSLVRVTCPVCAAAECRRAFVGQDPLSGEPFDVVRCTACGMAYVNPQPSGAALSGYYTRKYYGARHPFFKDFFMSLRAAKLGAPPAGARVLDVGCGRADFLLACRSRGWAVAGVEQDESPVMALREELGIDIKSPEHLEDFATAAFDAVTLWHVLEHLPNPRDVLRQAHRMLNGGGRLVIEVPNFGGWQARLGGEIWYHLDVPRHLLHFERSSLARLLDETGFRPLHWSTFSLEYDVFGMGQTMINRVCRQPNYLFHLLIGQPLPARLRDKIATFGLMLPAFAVAGIASLVAPLFGQGGVLRVVAEKTS